MSARGTAKARGGDGREVDDASTGRAPPPARTYAREEVRESDGCEGRANLVIVDGGVFDVTAWASEHPGGRTVLEQYAGRDITDAFAAYHGGMRACGRGWRRCARASSARRARAAPPKHVKGFRELRDRVEGEKKYLKSLFSDYVFIIGRLVLFFGVTLACVLGEESGFWTHMLGAVSLGLFWQQSMFIGHDAGHNSITFDRNKDAMIGWCVGNVFNGVGIAWWMATHNAPLRVQLGGVRSRSSTHTRVCGVRKVFQVGVFFVPSSKNEV